MSEFLRGEGGMTRVGAAGVVAAVAGAAVASGFIGMQLNDGDSEARQRGQESGVEEVAAVEPASLDGSALVGNGDDATIGAEVAQDLYKCGGIKGETWEGKPFTPNHLFDHMNANLELAEDDLSDWVAFMGRDAFVFAVDHSLTNDSADQDLTVEGMPDEYSTFLRNQIPMQGISMDVADNHMCVDTDHDGDLDTSTHANFKNTAGGTYTGLVMSNADFAEWMSLVEEDRDLELVIKSATRFKMDLDGDGKEEVYYHITNKHEICGNNNFPVVKKGKPQAPPKIIPRKPPVVPPHTPVKPPVTTTTTTTKKPTTTTTTAAATTTTTTGGTPPTTGPKVIQPTPPHPGPTTTSTTQPPATTEGAGGSTPTSVVNPETQPAPDNTAPGNGGEDNPNGGYTG